MNFLLHRHFAEIELGSPAAGVGAMLPDLWRMADRRVRPVDRRASTEAQPAVRGDPASEDALFQTILAGIEHHLTIDRWFHDTPELLEGERFCAVALRAAAPPSLRPGLFAHIAWEMALDGALVASIGLDTLSAKLKADLAAASAALAKAAEAHHFDRIDRSPADREAFDSRMRRITDELAQSRAGGWIHSYTTGEGLAACVDGVRARIGLPRMGPADRPRLGAALDDVAARARGALGSLIDRRASALASGALAT